MWKTKDDFFFSQIYVYSITDNTQQPTCEHFPGDYFRPRIPAVIRKLQKNIKNRNSKYHQESDLLFDINILKTKCNLLYIRNQFVPRSKHFPPRL